MFRIQRIPAAINLVHGTTECAASNPDAFARQYMGRHKIEWRRKHAMPNTCDRSPPVEEAAMVASLSAGTSARYYTSLTAYYAETR